MEDGGWKVEEDRRLAASTTSSIRYLPSSIFAFSSYLRVSVNPWFNPASAGTPRVAEAASLEMIWPPRIAFSPHRGRIDGRVRSHWTNPSSSASSVIPVTDSSAARPVGSSS